MIPRLAANRAAPTMHFITVWRNYPMNKTELIAAVAEKSGLSKKDAAAAVESVIAAVSDSLVKGAPARTPRPALWWRSPLPRLPLSRPARL